MAYTDIDKSDDYFNINLWTGTGSTQSITGVNFQPDWLWVKTRSTASNHRSQNSVIGAEYGMNPNQTVAEGFLSDCVTSFDSDGFTLGADSQGYVNTSSRTYVGWSWLASNSTASNTDGSITSTVSANTTSGFSVVSYTGTGSTATVGHGLGVTPALIIVKDRTNGGTSWVVWNKNFSSLTNNYLTLQTYDGVGTFSNYWGTSAPTSLVFGVGSGGLDNNNSSANMIAYCFAEKKGFSKFGQFTSVGSNDGAFVYCGFKPAYVMIKANVTDSWANWYIFDTKRDPYNIADLPQYANLAIQDGYYGGTPATNYSQIDILSNGFKIRRDGNWGVGANGQQSFFWAFAENPLVTSTGIPACAR